MSLRCKIAANFQFSILNSQFLPHSLSLPKTNHNHNDNVNKGLMLTHRPFVFSVVAVLKIIKKSILKFFQ